MQSETLAYAREVLWEQDLPLAALLDSQFTYLTPDLAKHYGIEPAGEGLQRYDLIEHAARGGLLTQGSVLTVGGDEASMVARGLFLMHELMRGVVKDPPPCVDTTPQPSQPGRTQRAIAESRIANSACGGCHSKFEPLAFGLEKFDGLGGYADTDHHGNSLREDGNILFPGQAEPVAYRTSGQLMELLAASPRVQESLTWKLTQFAVGRPLGPSDASSVADIHARAQQDGGTYAATLQAILLSDLVLNHPKE